MNRNRKKFSLKRLQNKKNNKKEKIFKMKYTKTHIAKEICLGKNNAKTAKIWLTTWGIGGNMIPEAKRKKF